jgi:hypothetical protein
VGLSYSDYLFISGRQKSPLAVSLEVIVKSLKDCKIRVQGPLDALAYNHLRELPSINSRNRPEVTVTHETASTDIMAFYSALAAFSLVVRDYHTIHNIDLGLEE